MSLYYGGKTDSEKNRTFKLTQPLIKYKTVKGKKEEQIDPTGKATGDSPWVAARKLARRILRSHIAEGHSPFGGKPFKFTIKEITRGGKGKEFTYLGWNQLTKNVVKKIAGKRIVQSIDVGLKKHGKANNNSSNNK